MDQKNKNQHDSEIAMCWAMNDTQKAEIERLRKEQLRLAHEVGRLRAALGKIVSDGDYTAPEGTKHIASKALGHNNHMQKPTDQ